MKRLELEVEITVCHVRKAIITDREKGTEVVYYQHTIEVPLFPETEKATSSQEFKVGKHKVKLTIEAKKKGEDAELKLRLAKLEEAKK